jgi:hypothetical protein
LSLGFYNHSLPCLRGGLRWRCTPGPSAPAPSGACCRHFYVDGGRSRTFNSGTSQGPAVNVFTLVVGAPGPLAPAPLGGSLSKFSHWWWALPDLQFRHLPGAHRRCFHVDGGRSQIFNSGTSQGPSSTFSHWCWALPDLQLQHLPGARRRRFHVGGGRSSTFSSGTSRGPAADVFTLMLGAPGPLAPAPPGGPPLMFSRWWWALPDLQLWDLPGARRRLPSKKIR